MTKLERSKRPALLTKMVNGYRKLRILVGMVRGVAGEWRKEVWSRDLNERYCCDGRECGCFGSTVYEVYGPPKPEGGAP